ncbi:hypothetical protein [Methanococcoides sp. FTZ1]|uniref:hypothetical protein n=1 Tax=Methanococcoides sp. FTZ1 TaxID=3439061 RepID=UPI003F86BDB2
MSKQRICLVIGVLLALSLVLVSVAAAVPPTEKNLQKARLLTPTKTVSFDLVNEVTFDWTDVRNAGSYRVFIFYSEPGEENWISIYVEDVGESNIVLSKDYFPPGNDYSWYVIAYGDSGYSDSFSRTAYFTVV